jgi:hypothetical protein
MLSAPALLMLATGSSSSATAATPITAVFSAGLCLWVQQHLTQLGSLGITQACPNRQLTAADLPNVGHAQPGGPAQTTPDLSSPNSSSLVFGKNVDATTPNEDVASGQSETAIAARGPDVVSAWNDATGFFIGSSTTPQGSLTGVGFSSDGGNSFTDLVGLPNNNPDQRWSGDPTVVSWTAPNGTTYFYVASLYLPNTLAGFFEIALSVGTVSGSSISFSNPIVVANGGGFFSFLGFLDKEFAAIDRTNGRIVVSYTNFNAPTFNGEIDLAVCNIAVNPASPTCLPGSAGPTYQVIAPQDPVETQQGSYPTVNPATGDAYVVWNKNFITNFFDGDPFTHQLAAHVPASCLTGVPCPPPAQVTVRASVKSLDMTTIPGYNRVIGQDFPRIAFNSVTNQVVFVWNEANAHPLGDIVLATADPALSSVSSPRRVNDDTSLLKSFALHFLPAVSVDAKGDINVSWYDRRKAMGTSQTDLYAASIPPGSNSSQNIKVTDTATDWLATGSIIIPNFGDYTDNTSDGNNFFVNWSDGRIGIPNSFVGEVAS